jgi:predicted GNAT family acetyltransferase
VSAVLRLQMDRDGATAVLDYSFDEVTLSILHVETPPALRGRGIGGELVEKARALAHEKNLELVAICGFARNYLASHPDPAK